MEMIQERDKKSSDKEEKRKNRENTWINIKPCKKDDTTNVTF